ncbi:MULTISPECIES: hypothetical protein [unclassified Myroides]|uniref:hypothetical protein n=1 Tax=unclassified Myroides TaxID=2642485 RepID=UPI0015F7BADA|nr:MULTISPECIES: hypothetical protein [unclassified Myroides]MBB1150870.1 hypothetical protein [Myroides sp. NP-2]MDM1407822.1 hypothetical protein [Myroides sp. DF42-4-2]
MNNFFLALCLSLCTWGITLAQEVTPKTIVVKQGEKTLVIDQKTQNITLKPERFSIEFLNKPYQDKKKLFYAAKAMLTDNSQFVNEYESMSFDDISFFSPGTGFAAPFDKNQFFPFLSEEGHQYLYYASNSDHRINKIGKQKEWDIYQWNLDGVTIDGNEIKWEDYRIGELYLYFVVDQNLNNIIDPDEHHLIRITFKK